MSFRRGSFFINLKMTNSQKLKNAISFLYKNRNSFLNFSQREDYDFEELERKLVKN